MRGPALEMTPRVRPGMSISFRPLPVVPPPEYEKTPPGCPGGSNCGLPAYKRTALNRRTRLGRKVIFSLPRPAAGLPQSLLGQCGRGCPWVVSPEIAEAILHEHNATVEAVQPAQARAVHLQAVDAFTWCCPFGLSGDVPSGSDHRSPFGAL